MSRYNLIFSYFILYLIQFTCGSNLFNVNCTNICGDDTNKNEIESCKRGCRLFNIIDAQDSDNVNITKQECYKSCVEAYEKPTYLTCQLGCDKMSKERELHKSFVFYIEQDSDNSLMILQPDIDQIDIDFLLDPDLRQQLDFTYRIPETHIRTMPISDESANFDIPPDIKYELSSNGDWLDCASRNSGIPRWMLISAILLAVLLGVWIIFTPEKRDPLIQPVSHESTDIDKLMNPFVDNKWLIHTPPPKYSLESDKN